MPIQPKKKHQIGQVIYILSEKAQKIIPAIIAEEMIHKVRKPDGIHEIVNYKIYVGPRDKQQILDLQDLRGEIFSSVEEVRKLLSDRLQNYLQNIVEKAKANVKSWYGIDPGVEEIFDENSPDVILEDGETRTSRSDPMNIIDQIEEENGVKTGFSQASPNQNFQQLFETQEDEPKEIILPDGTRTKL